MVTVPNLTEAPWAQPWFVGVASVRGALYGCTDLAAFLGLAEPMPAGESRLLLVHPRFGVNAALRIERALGLRALSDLSPVPLPQNAAAWEISHWLGADDQSWAEISMQEPGRDARFSGSGTVMVCPSINCNHVSRVGLQAVITLERNRNGDEQAEHGYRQGVRTVVRKIRPAHRANRK